MKSLSLLFIAIIFSNFAFAETRSFEVTGGSCVDPIWNERPNYHYAKRDADDIANETCYPFQGRRVSEYVLSESADHCPSRFFGAIAVAKYICAQ